MTDVIDSLMRDIAEVRVSRPVGRIATLGRGLVEVRGLAQAVAVGDRLAFAGTDQGGEALAIAPGAVTVLPEGGLTGLRLGMAVLPAPGSALRPDPAWIGRVIDPFGQPLDGRPLPRGPVPMPVACDPPPATARRPMGARCSTGMAVFDTLLPILRGQRIGLFAGSGVGKSTLLARMATGLQADVVVVGLVGERGREVREFVDRVLGPQGMARSVVVAATSDRAPLVRRRCAWSAMAVAEYFRDRGRHVLLLLDSVTRFAEAHRDIALALGEPSGTGGFPPSTGQLIMSLAERAGPGGDGAGDITTVFSVLVAGSDMDGYVADTLRGVLDGHVVLDRRIAERGRFPAVDLLRSVSRALPGAATAEENALITAARRHLGAWDRAEMMVQAGLYQTGADAEVDRAVALFPRLDAFLSEPAEGGIAGSFARLSALMSEP
jgi:flagellum-specific ATP synthase